MRSWRDRRGLCAGAAVAACCAVAVLTAVRTVVSADTAPAATAPAASVAAESVAAASVPAETVLVDNRAIIAALPVPLAPEPAAGAQSRRVHAFERPAGWTLLDGFEHPNWPDPNLWTLSRTDAPTWWPSLCQAREGIRGLWAFGGPTSRGEVPCAAPVPAATTSSILLHLDLTQATAAHRLDLFFDLWLGFPPGSQSGLFVSLLVPDGTAFKRVTVLGATSDAGRWAQPARRLDLTSLADISSPTDVYDLRGGDWYLEWLALAPNGANAGSGAFIDNLNLVWEPDPAVATPTVRATLTPTATATATRTAVATSTPSAPPPAYLPRVVNMWPVPTETTAPSATPGTPDPTATVTPIPVTPEGHPGSR